MSGIEPAPLLLMVVHYFIIFSLYSMFKVQRKEPKPLLNYYYHSYFLINSLADTSNSNFPFRAKFNIYITSSSLRPRDSNHFSKSSISFRQRPAYSHPTHNVSTSISIPINRFILKHINTSLI